MENYSIFIDEPVTHFSEKSMNILLKWMDENETLLKGNRASTKISTHQNEEGPNWIFG